MIKQAFLCIVLIFHAIFTTFAGSAEYDRELVEAARDMGKRYALVIGVEYVGNNALKWTVDDAVEIGWLLEKEFGFEVTCAITRYPKDRERKKRTREIDALVGVEYTDKEGILSLFDEGL